MNNNSFSRRVFLAGSPVVVAGCAAAAAQSDKSDPSDRSEKKAKPDAPPTSPTDEIRDRMQEGRIVQIPAWYYQHFDADYSLDVSEEGFGGWKKETLPFGFDHTALVVMHAWDAGTREQYPGWHRCVPYIPRSYVICDTIFPPLLGAVRKSGMAVFHVVGGSEYCKDLPGYKHAKELAGPEPPKGEMAAIDPSRERLDAFKNEKVFVGAHNADDVKRGLAHLGFARNAKPLDSEGVAENARQLFALCKERHINHLVYIGFAINWCLLLSPGGMADMGNKYGMMCSTIRQATTAVENKESARKQLGKELALWRVALAFGFVFDNDDFSKAIASV